MILFLWNGTMGPFSQLLSHSCTEIFLDCVQKGNSLQLTQSTFYAWPPPLSLLTANDKLMIIYWMCCLFFYCFLLYCLNRKFVVKTIFTIVNEWKQIHISRTSARRNYIFSSWIFIKIYKRPLPSLIYCCVR